MYKIITSINKIRKLQGILKKEFKKAATHTCYPNLGFQGGSVNEKTFYSEDLEIWLCPKTATDSYGEENRFWNAFGTIKPKDDKSLNIVCEINFPLADINRRIAGAFAEDETGKTVIIHRGKIGGGRKGIGKSLFFENFRGEFITVIDGDKNTEVALVADLNSEDMIYQISDFVTEVGRIKELNPNEITNSDAHSYNPEFQGIKQIPPREQIEARCNHGWIVSALAEQLQSQGKTIGNNKFIDLFIVNKKKQIKTIFEVKTDNSSSSIYSAIGQLVVYGADLNCNSFIVIPEKLDKKVTTRLQEIGIGVITYSIASGDVIFDSKTLTFSAKLCDRKKMKS